MVHLALAIVGLGILIVLARRPFPGERRRCEAAYPAGFLRLYPNPPYDYSAEARGLVFTAGACPLDENGTTVAPGDYEAQAERAVGNLLEALAERGAGTDALLKTTIYVVGDERDDLVRVWDVASARLGRAPSTLLGVSLLGYPDQLVEIEAVAALPSATA